jgi:hypothetical protein
MYRSVDPETLQESANFVVVFPDDGEIDAATETDVAALTVTGLLTLETIELLARQPGVYEPAAAYLQTAAPPRAIVLHDLSVLQRVSSSVAVPPETAHATVNELAVVPDDGDTDAATERVFAALTVTEALTLETMELLTRQPGVYDPAAVYVQVAVEPDMVNQSSLVLQRPSRSAIVPFVWQVSVTDALPSERVAEVGDAEAVTPAEDADTVIAIAVSSIPI